MRGSCLSQTAIMAAVAQEKFESTGRRTFLQFSNLPPPQEKEQQPRTSEQLAWTVHYLIFALADTEASVIKTNSFGIKSLR